MIIHNFFADRKRSLSLFLLIPQRFSCTSNTFLFPIGPVNLPSRCAPVSLRSFLAKPLRLHYNENRILPTERKLKKMSKHILVCLPLRAEQRQALEQAAPAFCLRFTTAEQVTAGDVRWGRCHSGQCSAGPYLPERPSGMVPVQRRGAERLFSPGRPAGNLCGDQRHRCIWSGHQ